MERVWLTLFSSMIKWNLAHKLHEHEAQVASTILGTTILMYEAHHRFPMEGISINFSMLLEYIVQNPAITILVTIFGFSLNRIRQNRLTLQKWQYPSVLVKE